MSLPLCSVDGCGLVHRARGFCSGHYQRWRKGAPLEPPLFVKQTLEDRFWGKVDRGNIDECWLWTASTDRNGYGQFRIEPRTVKAHRLAYELLVGPIPSGMEPDHTCHTADESCSGGYDCLHRRCVNPFHMEPVTHRENMQRAARNMGRAA